MTKSKKNIDNNDELGYSADEEIVLSAEGGSASGGEESTALDSLKRLREKLKKCVSEKQQYLDGWQRTKADFINYKKDEGERKGELVKFAKEDFIQRALPVLDSFNMARKSDSWNDGIEQIFKQFLSILKKEGVEEINPKGEDFNPNLHEAVEVVDGPEGKIVEVIQSGYSLNGKIIRPARVKVGK